MNRPSLFCFGLGYSASVLADRLLAEGWEVAGTTRRTTVAAEDGVRHFSFARGRPLSAEGRQALEAASHVLVSIPPDADGDPALDTCRSLADVRPDWIGYLSSTSVYGDTAGRPVDEDSALHPSSARGERRVLSERSWLEFGHDRDVAVQIFRLAGIYGPGRSAFDRLRAETTRRIDRPGHRFSRIHVDDIVSVLVASIRQPNPGRIYNVADNEPAEPEKVLAFAAELLGIEPPPLVSFEEASRTMSPMGRSFWRDNRVVISKRIREELGVEVAYPTFREGLRAILDLEPSED